MCSVELGSVVEAAVETVRLSAAKEALQQVLDPLAGIVSGDPARLQQIVWNLLSNAFHQRVGECQLERVNSHLEISVIDTGQGIAGVLPHVFDRFQARPITRNQDWDSGLPLSEARPNCMVVLYGPSAGEGKELRLSSQLACGGSPEEVEPDDFDKEH